MDGFIFFIIFVFVVIPILKNIIGAGKKPKSKFKPQPQRPQTQTQNTRTSQNPRIAQQKPEQVWGQSHQQIQQKIAALAERNARAKRDAHGHSNARQHTRSRLQANTDSRAYPENHNNRVRKRQQRDQSARKKIETSMHSKKNRAIIRASNKGIDTWGERGDRTNFGGLITLCIIGVIGYLIYLNFGPEIRDLLNL